MVGGRLERRERERVVFFNASPAIKSVLQEIKKSFLHHVCHLEEKEEQVSWEVSRDSGQLTVTVSTSIFGLGEI